MARRLLYLALMKRSHAFRYMLMTLAVSTAAGLFPGTAAVARGAVKSTKSGRAKSESSASTEASSEIKKEHALIGGTPDNSLSAGAALRKAKEIQNSVLGEENAARLAHAKELLGKYYAKSIVRVGGGVADLNTFVKERIEEVFEGPNEKYAKKIYGAILEESRKHGFDPIFLMAVIENESSFKIKARGTSGEIGLMQLMPDTGKWIAQKIGVEYHGAKTLEDPVLNIRIGAAYMAHLREKFDSHSQLYLAAYNMGQGNVHRALANQVWPKDYPIRVMQRYVRFYTELSEERSEKKIN